MNLNPSVYFLNVLCDKEKRYRIHTVWNDNSFILTVIDDFKAYRSNISETLLKKLAEKYEVVFEFYMNELRSSLCNKNLNNINYKRHEDTFTISKKQDNILVQFADFKISEIDFNNVAVNIMDEINASSQFYKNEALLSRKEMETVVEEKNKYVKKLEEFVNKKKDMEHELYSKFILILNEKKLRIQYLQESLQKFKREGQVDNEIKIEINGSKRETISDSDTETSIDEPGEIIVHNVQIECNEETLKKKLDIFDEGDPIKTERLPKRSKISENPGPSGKSTAFNKEITNSPEIVVETMKEDSQDSVNFNTQDLLDRL